MKQAILSPSISKVDADTSSASLDLFRPFLTSHDRSLVFFVGAGASIAGNTGMPSTPTLLYHLLTQALSASGKFDLQSSALPATLKEISAHIGFEITLNDFWQICRQATALLYRSFADLEMNCVPNRVHTFLAYWLSTGGTVITTNYDCLIEREWIKLGGAIQSRYRKRLPLSFVEWKKELNQGGILFKIHGSLDDPRSCLGALEHVGTQLAGHRAELLKEVIRNRPLCFIGWRGVDPDIPTLLYNMLDKRDTSLPTFWIHYEGYPAGSITLQETMKECSVLIRPYAGNHPILTDADRACGEFLHWVGIQSYPNPKRKTESFDFSQAISHCTKSGLVRMVGITLRRAKKYDEAETVLKEALNLTTTSVERNAALQEIALLQQQTKGRDTDQARESLIKASKVLEEEPDIHLQLNTDFGLLSMSIVALKKRPWLLFKIPSRFCKYREDIEILQKKNTDKKSVALHNSLYWLYAGRLRFKLFGWLGVLIRPVGNWILQPFEVAHSTIGDAKDIHLHSRIDVLAYRAIALAYLGHCQEMQKNVPEIRRLINILNDDARTQHWEKQEEEIRQHCNRK